MAQASEGEGCDITTLSIERGCEKHIGAIVRKGKATEETWSWKDSSVGHVFTISLFIFLQFCRIAVC